MPSITLPFLYAAGLPALAAFIGVFLPTFITLTQQRLAYVQHFVAGVVLSALAVSLLPEVLKSSHPRPVLVGFIVGALLLIALHVVVETVSTFQLKQLPFGAAFASMIDLFVDGLLIGVALHVSMTAGLTVGGSLAFCAFTLACALGGQVRSLFAKGIIGICLAMMIPLGAFVAITYLPLFSKGFYYEILSFGVAGLLFLACEELLATAHIQKDSTLSTAFLFAGFLLPLAFHLYIS